MFFRSIRFRIILWYALFLTLVLLAFSAVLYGGFSKNLYDDFDDLLVSRADGVANSIIAYAEAAGPAEPPDGSGFMGMAKSWVEDKRKDPGLMSIYTRILRTDGSVAVASSSMPSFGESGREPWEDILDGDDDFDTVKGQYGNGRKERFRVYTRPVRPGGGTIYVVQTAGPLRLVALALKNLAIILFILIPLTVFLAVIPAVMLIRLTLKPVDRMIGTLKRITAENLKSKIHLPDTKDEIKRLADTFNEMIERLDTSFSAHQRFVQQISRELKQPIEALCAELAVSADAKSPEGARRELLARASSQLASFSRDIENLIAFSLFDHGTSPLEIRKVDLGLTVDKALSGVMGRAREKGVDVSVFFPGDIVIDGDGDRLTRLFVNLLDNAVKYTCRGGRVAVTASREGDWAKIAVSDTGAGISEEDIDYIFDRFYQAAKSAGSRDGFGLGLSTVKSIVDSHKGSVSVESSLGKGSMFIVRLPVSFPG